jgi:hypothetical protein
MDYITYENVEAQMETLVEHEDLLLSRSKSIELALENVIENSIRISENDLRENLSIALADAEVEDEERFTEAVVGFLRIVMLKESQAIVLLKEAGASEDFQDFLILCSLKYGGDLQQLNFRERQGSNWWSFIEVDQIRTVDNIRHRHRFVIDRNREIEIDSIPYSDWVLVRHFLQHIMSSYDLTARYEGYNPEDDDPMELINEEIFNGVRRLIYALESEFEKRSIELPSREELLESEDQGLEENGG